MTACRWRGTPGGCRPDRTGRGRLGCSRRGTCVPARSSSEVRPVPPVQRRSALQRRRVRRCRRSDARGPTARRGASSRACVGEMRRATRRRSSPRRGMPRREARPAARVPGVAHPRPRRCLRNDSDRHRVVRPARRGRDHRRAPRRVRRVARSSGRSPSGRRCGATASDTRGTSPTCATRACGGRWVGRTRCGTSVDHRRRSPRDRLPAAPNGREPATPGIDRAPPRAASGRPGAARRRLRSMRSPRRTTSPGGRAPNAAGRVCCPSALTTRRAGCRRSRAGRGRRASPTARWRHRGRDGRRRGSRGRARGGRGGRGPWSPCSASARRGSRSPRRPRCPRSPRRGGRSRRPAVPVLLGGSRAMSRRLGRSHSPCHQ